jgi:hypothetical protein
MCSLKVEVLSTLDRFIDAVSRKDLDAVFQLFAPDPDVFLVDRRPMKLPPVPEIRRHLQCLFARPVTYR